MLIEPKLATVKKYGLSLDEWREMAKKQNFVCYVCQKEPKNSRLCTDHEHVKGWKKMPAEQRKLYVRGLLCSFCNLRLIPKGMNLAKAKQIVAYLEEYEARRPPDGVGKK